MLRRPHLALLAVYALLVGVFVRYALAGHPVLWMLAGAAGVVLAMLILLYVTDERRRPQ